VTEYFHLSLYIIGN